MRSNTVAHTNLLKRLSYSTAAITLAVGVAVLIGWYTGSHLLKASSPAGLVMKANTAAAFVLCGASLLLILAGRSTGIWIARVFSSSVALIGLVTLCEYAFSWNPGLDQLLFREEGRLMATSHAGRMAPNTAANFLSIGVALLLLSFDAFRGKLLVEFLLIFSLVISILGLVGFLTGLTELTGPAVFTQIAGNTVVTFILLCIGALLAAYVKQDRPVTIEQKLFAGLTMAAAIVVFISFLSISGIKSLVVASAWISHSQQVKGFLADINTQLAEMQAGSRGFVLSGSPYYVAQFERAATRIPEAVNALRVFTLDNERHQKIVPLLEGFVARRMEFSRQIIEAKLGRDVDEAKLILTDSLATLLTDSIRATIGRMMTEEDRLLELRGRHEQAQADRNRIIIYSSLGVQMALLGFIFIIVNRDVAGRRKAEQVLLEAKEELETRVGERTADLLRASELARASEARVSGIVNSAMDAIISVDEDQKIVLFNAAAERMFRCSTVQVLGKPIDAFIPHHLRERHRVDIEKFGKKGITSRKMGSLGALTALRADGEEFPIEASISQIAVGGQKLFTVILRDITERHHAEQNLRESEERFRKLFVRHPLPSWVFDRESFRFLEVNDAAVRHYGYSREEFLSMTIKDIRPPEDVERLKQDVALRRTSDDARGIWRHKKKDGSLIQVEITTHELDFGGQDAVLVIANDVTARIKAEEERRASESRYRSTLDHMMEGCQIIGRDWRYLYVNEVAARHGRRSREELVGRTMMEIFPGIDKAPFFGELRRCMTERIPIRMENEFTYPDGSRGWFNLSMEPVPEGVFILSEDITEAKQLNEELVKYREHLEELVEQRTGQLEAANKELEAFSYSVSHDLRAPLRHIGGFVELLGKRLGDSVDEQVQRHLSVISGSTKRMGMLIDDLLSFSRMSRVEMRQSRVNLGSIVRAAIDDVKAEVKDREVQWKVADLPEVHGDSAMLKLVLQNLVANAVKYTRPRPRACIEINWSEGANDEVVVFVRDNGVGFDMRYVDKLFGVFQRLHREDEFEGTGIGLANVRRIISRHGGRVWAESTLGEGATFYFSLPKTRPIEHSVKGTNE